MTRYLKNLRLLCVLCLGWLSASAQDYVPEKVHYGFPDYKETHVPKWYVSIQYGPSLAFGDDSYNVFKDFKNACGRDLALGLGYQITPVFDVQARLRILKLYSRVNLECMDANIGEHPELFPRDGFYGYDGAAFALEGRMNLINLLWPERNNKLFNLNLIAGGGINYFESYDKHAEKWSATAGYIQNGTFEIDVNKHRMSMGVVGGSIDLRVFDSLSLNLELIGTITGDMMEGVKYEEFYDVYVTATAGLTVYF